MKRLERYKLAEAVRREEWEQIARNVRDSVKDAPADSHWDKHDVVGLVEGCILARHDPRYRAVPNDPIDPILYVERRPRQVTA